MHSITTHIGFGPLARNAGPVSFRLWQQILWFALFSSSGLVFFEPAPFDLLSLGIFSLFLILGLRIPSGLHYFLVCFGLFLGASFIGSVFANIISDATMHIVVTAFLVIVSLMVASLMASGNRKMAHLMWQGWLMAGVIATFAGAAGFLELFPGAEKFTKYGRAMGTFKDPNVFGPFLIPPVIYAFMRFMRERGFLKFIYLGLLGVMSMGIVLSLSRAAMGHLVISMLIAMVAILLTAETQRERGKLIIFIIIAGIIGVLGVSVLLSVENFSNLVSERLNLTQSYDSGGQGRFDGQAKALSMILEAPLGIGANEFLYHWPEAPHNVYLTNFLSGGWIAGFSYIALVLVTVGLGLKGAFTRSPYRLHMIVAGSSFAGLVIVGMVVDSDHWRHFYILLGAIWGFHIAMTNKSLINGRSGGI